MILSHKNKFIFVKTKKTAGSSISYYLWSILGNNDIRANWSIGKQDKNGFYNHIPARDIIKICGKEIWEKYFTFTIVRHPMDRMISQFFWTTKREKKYTTFHEFLKGPHAKNSLNYNIICSSSEKILNFDHILKYEEQPDSFFQMLKENKLPLTENELSRKKSGIRSDYTNWKTFIDKKDIEYIKNTEPYATEIKIHKKLGYII